MTTENMKPLQRLGRKIGRLLGNTRYDDPFSMALDRPWTWRSLFPPYAGLRDTRWGVDITGNTHKDKRWFRWTFKAADTGLRKIDDLYYWIIYRVVPSEQYHIVRTGLRPGYCDVPEVMFEACFALLGRFVEHELGPIPSDFSEHYDEGTGRVSGYRGYRIHSEDGIDQQAIDLWLWFKHELPVIEKLYADDMNACYGDTALEFSSPDANGLSGVTINVRQEPKYPYEWPSNVRDEKLRELIELRTRLWT